MLKLTTIQRAQIIGLNDVPGQTAATIAHCFGVAKSTVRRLRQKYIKTNDVTDLPRPTTNIPRTSYHCVSYLKEKIDLLHGQQIKIVFKQVESTSVYFLLKNN